MSSLIKFLFFSIALMPALGMAQKGNSPFCPTDSAAHGQKAPQFGQHKGYFNDKKPFYQFSPQEFMRQEENFITRKAQLTPTEATFLFPLFHKMKELLRENDKKIGLLRYQIKKEPHLTDKQCLTILNDIHRLQEDGLQIEADYQKKILKGLSARKYLLVLNASKSFDREMLRHMIMTPHKKPSAPPQRKVQTSK